MQLKVINIKGVNIPVRLNSAKNYIHFKISFNILKGYMNISKPAYMPLNKVMLYIHENEELIYNEYLKVLNKKEKFVEDNNRKWVTGEKLLYKGKEYYVIVNEVKENIVDIKIDEINEKIIINIYEELSKEERIYNIVKIVKKIFKNNTEKLVYDRLNVLTKKTGINYNTFKVKYVKTRWGSCVKSTKSLNFSSRLIMFPINVVDSVVIHELCHIIHANHGKDFWKLVYEYMPDYDKCSNYIKSNADKFEVE